MVEGRGGKGRDGRDGDGGKYRGRRELEEGGGKGEEVGEGIGKGGRGWGWEEKVKQWGGLDVEVGRWGRETRK